MDATPIVVLVKVVGEEDNDGNTEEMFRVAKKYTNLLMFPPTINTNIIVSKGSFCVNEIVQHIPHQTVYLFEYTWFHYRSIPEIYENLKNKYIEEGWTSVCESIDPFNDVLYSLL